MIFNQKNKKPMTVTAKKVVRVRALARPLPQKEDRSWMFISLLAVGILVCLTADLAPVMESCHRMLPSTDLQYDSEGRSYKIIYQDGEGIRVYGRNNSQESFSSDPRDSDDSSSVLDTPAITGTNHTPQPRPSPISSKHSNPQIDMVDTDFETPDLPATRGSEERDASNASKDSFSSSKKINMTDETISRSFASIPGLEVMGLNAVARQFMTDRETVDQKQKKTRKEQIALVRQIDRLLTKEWNYNMKKLIAAIEKANKKWDIHVNVPYEYHIAECLSDNLNYMLDQNKKAELKTIGKSVKEALNRLICE